MLLVEYCIIRTSDGETEVMFLYVGTKLSGEHTESKKKKKKDYPLSKSDRSPLYPWLASYPLQVMYGTPYTCLGPPYLSKQLLLFVLLEDEDAAS